MDSAAAFKCDGYSFKSSLARYLDRQRTLEGGMVCECTGEFTLGGGNYFFALSLKLTNHKQPKVTSSICH